METLEVLKGQLKELNDTVNLDVRIAECFIERRFVTRRECMVFTSKCNDKCELSSCKSSLRICPTCHKFNEIEKFGSHIGPVCCSAGKDFCEFHLKKENKGAHRSLSEVREEISAYLDKIRKAKEIAGKAEAERQKLFARADVGKRPYSSADARSWEKLRSEQQKSAPRPSPIPAPEVNAAESKSLPDKEVEVVLTSQQQPSQDSQIEDLRATNEQLKNEKTQLLAELKKKDEQNLQISALQGKVTELQGLLAEKDVFEVGLQSQLSDVQNKCTEAENLLQVSLAENKDLQAAVRELQGNIEIAQVILLEKDVLIGNSQLALAEQRERCKDVESQLMEALSTNEILSETLSKLENNLSDAAVRAAENDLSLKDLQTEASEMRSNLSAANESLSETLAENKQLREQLQISEKLLDVKEGNPCIELQTHGSLPGSCKKAIELLKVAVKKHESHLAIIADLERELNMTTRALLNQQKAHEREMEISRKQCLLQAEPECKDAPQVKKQKKPVVKKPDKTSTKRREKETSVALVKTEPGLVKKNRFRPDIWKLKI